MMIRLRNLEVPVAVGLLVLSAALGITGWNGHPSNGTEITGGQIQAPPILVTLFAECFDDYICSGTQGCGTYTQAQCDAGNLYEWEPTDSAFTTNCFNSSAFLAVCAQFAEGPQSAVCATATMQCKRVKVMGLDIEGNPVEAWDCKPIEVRKVSHSSRPCFNL
jgi:hypothetical protein